MSLHKNFQVDTVKPRYFESLRKFEQISDVRDILHSCQNIVDRNVIIGENGTKIFFFQIDGSIPRWRC